jgi:hypothetical protein
MNIHDSFPSKYLKAIDLGAHEPVVVIRAVELVTMTLETGKRLAKPVVFFVGKDKGLPLNKTNATAIAALLGSPETASWIGKAIRLYATPVTFKGTTVAGLRVKAAGLAAVPRAVSA